MKDFKYFAAGVAVSVIGALLADVARDFIRKQKAKG